MMRLFNKKSLKNLSENDLIIKWGDEIVFTVNEFGEISRASFDPSVYFAKDYLPTEVAEIRNHVIDSLEDKIGDATIIIPNELIRYLQGVKNHLLSNGYIEPPDVTKTFWRISDEGKLMKKYGGHKKYTSHKERQIKAEQSDQNSKIYWWKREIWKWAIGAVLGYGLRYLTEPKNTQSKDPQSQPTIQKGVVPTKLIGKDTTRHY
jgi:hypothetical protein